MPGSESFDRYVALFSSLKPLRHREDRHGSGKPVIRLTVKNGEPFLEYTGPKGACSSLGASDRKICDELARITDNADPFASVVSNDGRPKASIWENPYLVHMMESTPVEGPGRSLLRFSESQATLILNVDISGSGEQTDVSLLLSADGKETAGVVFLDDTHVLLGSTVYVISSAGPNYRHIGALTGKIGRSHLDAFLTLALTYMENVVPVCRGIPARRSSTVEHLVPTLYLEKVAADKALYLRTGASLESLGDRLPPGVEPTCAVHVGDDGRITVRNTEGCDMAERTRKLEEMILASAPDRNARKEVYRDGDFFIIPEATAGPFLLNKLPQVLEDFRLVGSEKLKAYRIMAAKPRLDLRFSSGIDFLEGEGDVVIGDEHFSISDILSQFAKKRYISLGDGSRGIIDEGYINRLQRLFRRRDSNGRIKVNLFDLPEVEEMLQSRIKGEFAARSRSVLEGFNSLSRKRKPSCKVKAILRPYQVEGVKWLRYLYDNNLGGCLADDMGLGKTLQTIALLSMIYPACTTPTLIVMPRSLLFNWERELDRFAPGITHSTYYGTDRDLAEALKANVVLTTYALVRNDIMKLKDVKFECVVLDESQNIKNVAAQTTVAVQMLATDHCLALSGTPMENNLTELYSLFRFLNPTMFGSVDEFNSSYTYPIQKYGDKEAAQSLRRKIFPFVMRRLKRDVLDDLPERIDKTIYVEMSEEQRRVYEERRLSYRRQIEEAIARDGVNRSQFVMFQALSELRRIASVPESVAGENVASPKIDELVESLSASVAYGHKSVVFFNFVAGLEITMSRLEQLGIGYETMTGSTSASARKRIVERFQSDPECRVLLMTLKVGGVGLNLTAADTVYIFEPWWNKAAEEQAVNRLHRIGQKSTVTAVSLITVGTIEEKILQLQEQKSELFNELINADTASSKHLSEKDIEFILS